MQLTTVDARIADLERQLAAERTRRLIAERRAAGLRRTLILLQVALTAGEAYGVRPVEPG